MWLLLQSPASAVPLSPLITPLPIMLHPRDIDATRLALVVADRLQNRIERGHIAFGRQWRR